MYVINYYQFIKDTTSVCYLISPIVSVKCATAKSFDLV